jgi:CubicO group peptidase (beta-lactamase class C family)
MLVLFRAVVLERPAMKIKAHFSLLASAVLCLGLAGAAPAGGDGPQARYVGDSEISAASLHQAIEPLFDKEVQEQLGETRALLVLHDGVIVAERYGDGFGPDSRMLSWSVAKTVTALLLGIMVSDGRLSLDEPVPVPAWQQGADPRGAITLRHMLNMASGIAHKEREGPLEHTDSMRMLVGDGAADMARYAEAKPLAATPGTTFQYNSATTLILSDMMTRLLTDRDDPVGRRDAMMRFVNARLAGPARLSSLTPEFDARGTMIGGAMMHMVARDYARLGELLRHNGRVAGRQIVAENWVRFLTSSSPHNPGYGGHLWINRAGAQDALFVGAAPDDLYAATGFRGQFVIVSPRQHLTLVRLGVSSDSQMAPLRASLARVIALAPLTEGKGTELP